MPLILGGITIGEVAHRLGISTATLKDWENKRLIPRARRAMLNRTRVWTEEQVQQIIAFMRER